MCRSECGLSRIIKAGSFTTHYIKLATAVGGRLPGAPPTPSDVMPARCYASLHSALQRVGCTFPCDGDESDASDAANILL